MDIVIKAFLAICMWFLTFTLGRYYDAITRHLFWVDTTDDCIFAIGTVISLGAMVWIAII